MCGIAGYKTSRPVDHEVLCTMVETLYHRGPDSNGFYRSSDYSAGIRRLKINDLITGDQPLFNEDKSIVLFYNGEIYNYPLLKEELKTKGYRFRTRSDGEVICHLYEEYGVELFGKLDGMFAVALWVEREKKLILARDIPGEKPLFYYILNDKEIIFASELKSLVLFPGLDLSLDYQGLWDFPTFTWIPQPDTVYKSIKVLPRGHLLISDNKGLRMRSYANRFNQHQIDLSDKGIIEETRQIVVESVKSRLLSDVPVGCFLSSGLDSSIVTTLASKALPSLSTFTIGFEDVNDPYHGRADEAGYAENYAKTLGTRHHTIRVKADDFHRDLLHFCAHGDQPFAVPSGLGILAIAKAAREADIKVLLSGDCADECFGGYSWYPCLQNNAKAQEYVNRGKDLITFNSFGLDLKERLAVLNSYEPQRRAWAWHYYASESEKKLLYNPEIFDGLKSSLRHFYEFNGSNIWSSEDYIKQDRNFYLPNEMLQKLDRMTMAYSVEGRVPFAAPAVLAHADKLNYDSMIRGNTLKWALREAFSDILPEEVYKRPKHGFNVPIDHWLKNEWADLLEETFASGSNLMKMGLIHRKSRDVAYSMLYDKNRVNGPTIFSFIVLNIWLGNYYRGSNS